MGQQEYNHIKEIAKRQQRIEKQILELQKNLEIAVLLDQPDQVFDVLKSQIERLRIKQDSTFLQCAF